jgi:predicted phosphodiesterase
MRVLVLPDIHFRRKAGGEDRRSLAAVKRYASDHAWDQVVLLGDVMDHASISHHNKAKLRTVSGESLFRDYEHANKGLDELAQAWSALKAPRVTVIEGNHDFRPEVLIEAQPQLEGLVETPSCLRLAERGWHWSPFWSRGTVLRIGKAAFIHGVYVTDHHAKQHVQRYGESVFYGHCHDVQQYSLVHAGTDSTLVGQSLGTLSELEQDYMQGKPNRWQQAFGVFHFRPNGNYNYYVVRIFDHRFTSPEGKLYRP